MARNDKRYTLREFSVEPDGQGVGPRTSLITPLRPLSGLDPGSAVWDIHTVSYYLQRSTSAERTLGLITIWPAVVARIVTGVFCLVTYAVVQRRREIALRLTLGASPSEVVGLITWSGASLALIGITTGAIQRWGCHGSLARSCMA